MNANHSTINVVALAGSTTSPCAERVYGDGTFKGHGCRKVARFEDARHRQMVRGGKLVPGEAQVILDLLFTYGCNVDLPLTEEQASAISNLRDYAKAE